MESVSNAELFLSKTMGGLPAAGLRRPAICGMNSPTRRKSKTKSLLAMRPLGGRPRVVPSRNSGASDLARLSGVTLKKRVPSGVVATPLRLSRLSMAWRASARVTLLFRSRESVRLGRFCERSSVRPLRRSSMPRNSSSVPPGMAMGPTMSSSARTRGAGDAGGFDWAWAV